MMSTEPPHRSIRWLEVLAVLGIFGQALFLVAAVMLPFFQPGYDPVDDAISTLLLGPYGFLLSVALFAAGLSSLALALGILQTTARGARRSLLGPVLVGV